MRRFLLAAFLLVVPFTANAATQAPTLDLTSGPGGIIRCASPVVSREEGDAVQAKIARGGGLKANPNFSVTIPIAFHVLTCNGQGNVPQSQIDAQVRELNSAYRGTGFKFTLASVDRTENCQWFSNLTGPGVEKKMKQALAIDPTHRLNVYTADLGHNLLGWAYFPQSFAESDPMSGVVFHYGTLPGAFLSPYNLGGTLDHESGHYLGLYHTFQGGCTAPGDYIDDTPFEASPAFGCPVGRNTCAQPGDDPIHDYMDYTDDACYSLFTAGQAVRMQTITQLYRPGLFGSSGTVAARAPMGLAQEAVDGASSTGLSFRGASPNPFSRETMLRFALPRSGHVSLKLFNLAGQQVTVLVDGERGAGEQSVTLKAGALAPGMYFAALRSGGGVVSRSVVLVP
jgi:pregnancy-associated plasma protein-A